MFFVCQKFSSTSLSPHALGVAQTASDKKSIFSSFPVGTSLPHVAHEKTSAGPSQVSKGSRAPS